MVVADASFPSEIPSSTLSDSFLNLERGDPQAFVPYWENLSDEESTVVIKGSELMSYLTETSNMCWYLQPELGDAIQRIHQVVGNAVTEDHYIVVGTGSTQLFMAALYALSPSEVPLHPVNVVAAAPYYWEYKDAIDFLQTRLFQWAGDAAVYDKNEPYIEAVTSPNNPDGTLRGPVVNSTAEGKVIYDFAYYWPQYTSITHPVDHDVSLFTFSKCTGHAGTRIGWAIVKDIEVAKKMIRFVHLSSIGVSKESQTRAAKILRLLSDAYQNSKSVESELFFEYSTRLMRERWERLRAVVEQSEVFTLIKHPTAYCNFTNETTESHPAFAWLKTEEGIENGESYLEKLKIGSKGGHRFGGDPRNARLSMIGPDDEFNEFLLRLSNAKQE